MASKFVFILSVGFLEMLCKEMWQLLYDIAIVEKK